VHKASYQVVVHFFTNHLELLFLKFESNLIEAILSLLVNGMSGATFEMQSECCTCINHFNEFVIDKLNSTSHKHQELIRSVRDFCSKNGGVFQKFLNEALFIVLFEDSRNVWIFQKVLFSTMIIANQQGCNLQMLISQLMDTHEKDEQRKRVILE